MRNRLFFVLIILLTGMSTLTAAELSGTYDKNFTVTTEFNTVSKGKTLRVKKGATFIMTDAIVSGNIIVEEGASFIAPKDGQGYLVFSQGTHVEGIDLYYKVRVSDTLVFTRKFPMTLDEIWKSGNQQLIEMVSVIEFCYSTSLKGWISINEWRFMNPFNENLFDDYDMIFTKSASQEPEPECRSLIVKNKASVVILPRNDPGRRSPTINESIIVEAGSSLTGTKEARLELRNGAKVQGIPLYLFFDDKPVLTETFLSDLWTQREFKKRERLTIHYDSKLKGWVFEDRLYPSDLTDDVKKKIEKIKK